MPAPQPITPAVPTVLPNPESIFPDAHAIVSPYQLPTYAGHRHAAGEVFAGMWVYPFPNGTSALKALARLQQLAADRGQVQP